jgi:hypothetical protein
VPSGRRRSRCAISGCRCSLAASGRARAQGFGRAEEQGKELLALESSARAEAFRLLLATVECAGEEARLAAEVNGLKQDDLNGSGGEPCLEGPRQAAWAGLPQDLREVAEGEAVAALRSLVRAAA